MFTACEHKFEDGEYMFMGCEYKFAVHKHKKCRTEKKNK